MLRYSRGKQATRKQVLSYQEIELDVWWREMPSLLYQLSTAVAKIKRTLGDSSKDVLDQFLTEVSPVLKYEFKNISDIYDKGKTFNGFERSKVNFSNMIMAINKFYRHSSICVRIKPHYRGNNSDNGVHNYTIEWGCL